MKKMISVVLLIFLLIPSAIAEEEWYFPFGFTKDTTYDEAIDKLLSMYEVPKNRILKQDRFFLMCPSGYTLFDTPLFSISLEKGDKNNKYKYILISLKDSYKIDGIYNFIKAVNFGIANSKSSIQYIEPQKTNYDLNGNPVITHFLNDPESFLRDFQNKSKNMKCSIVWRDMMILLERTSEEYHIDIFFLHPDYSED